MDSWVPLSGFVMGSLRPGDHINDMSLLVFTFINEKYKEQRHEISLCEHMPRFLQE